MDKIRALMIKCGLTPEMANRLCESLAKRDRHREQQLAEHKQRLETQYKDKEKKAAQICLEEVESHNRDLARRVQIYCEARTAAIDESAARQAANKDTEAITKLRNIASLVEGAGHNGEEKSGELLAENKKLRHRVLQLTKEKNTAVESANRSNAITAKALKNNRALEGRLQLESRSNDRDSSPRSTGRLDGSRTTRPTGQPNSTRPTLREHQEMGRPPAAAVAAVSGNGFPAPSDIARVIED